MSSSFFNTINLDGDKLLLANAKASAQEDLVQAIFEANPDKKLSPSQIQDIVLKRYNRNIPLTSWRRAMTNLTSKNILVKTGEKRVGVFSLPEHLWELNPESKESLQKFWDDFQNEPPDKPKQKWEQLPLIQ